MTERITEADLDRWDRFPSEAGIPNRLVAELRRLRGLIADADLAVAGIPLLPEALHAEARLIREEQDKA